MNDDLIRRLESAISSKSLHPNYARELLREAKEALEGEAVNQGVGLESEWCIPSDAERERLRRIGAIMDVPPSGLTMCNLSNGTRTRTECDVCHGESGGVPVGVACSSLDAVSFAYCDRCLANHAEPAGMLRTVISETGGIDRCAEWVRDLTGWHGGAYVPAADLPLLDLGGHAPASPHRPSTAAPPRCQQPGFCDSPFCDCFR